LLHLAAHEGSLDICNILIKAGIDVNITNTAKSTPLHLAVAKMHFFTARALVEAGTRISLFFFPVLILLGAYPDIKGEESELHFYENL